MSLETDVIDSPATETKQPYTPSIEIAANTVIDEVEPFEPSDGDDDSIESTKNEGKETTKDSQGIIPKESSKSETKEKGVVERPKGQTFRADTGPQVKKRDYSIFKPEDVDYLRRLPNDQFDRVADRVKSFYTLEKQLEEAQSKAQELEKATKPLVAYDHPEAYTLSDEYKSLTGNYSKADFEYNHLQRQLGLARLGKSWKAITGWRGNEPVYSEAYSAANQQGKINPNQLANDETAIMTALNRADSVKQQIQQQASQLQTQFGNTYKGACDSTNQAMTKFIASLPEDVRPKNELVEKVLAQSHPALRHLPTTQVAAQAIVIVDQVLKKLADYEKKVNVTAKIKQDEKKAGPKATRVGATKSSEDLIDFDEVESSMT